MKRSYSLMVAIAISCLFAVPSFAQVTVFSQGPFVPTDGDYGAFSSVLAAPGVDPEATIAFDNFTLGADYDINGICWHGIYDEAFPSDPADTDFIINIWGDNAGVPDLTAPLWNYFLAGGEAGANDEDVATTALGYTSPVTPAVPTGGGEAYGYEAALPVTSLAGGTQYWLSIEAFQTFPNTENDPIWMWHLGQGTDGFYASDFLDPAGTPAYGILQTGKNLSFELKAVPEPSGIALVFASVLGLGLIRRRRS